MEKKNQASEEEVPTASPTETSNDIVPVSVTKSPNAATLMVIDSGFDLRGESLQKALDWEKYDNPSQKKSFRQTNYEIMDEVIDKAPENYQEIRPVSEKVSQLALELKSSGDSILSDTYDLGAKPDPCQKSPVQLQAELKSLMTNNSEILGELMDQKTSMRLGKLDHGTHVSGIAVNGIEDKVKLVPVAMKMDETLTVDMSSAILFKSCYQKNNQKSCQKIDESINKDMATFEEALKNGSPDIVNMSFGSPSLKDLTGSCLARLFGGGNEKIRQGSAEMFNKMYKKKFEIMARYPNTNFVMAAGNSNEELFQGYGKGLVIPPNVVIVGSINKKKERSVFSNFSSKTNQVDIYASGENVASTVYNAKEKHIMSGTSQATPKVSRMLAIIKEKNPNLNATERKAMLLQQFASEEEHASGEKKMKILNE